MTHHHGRAARWWCVAGFRKDDLGRAAECARKDKRLTLRESTSAAGTGRQVLDLTIGDEQHKAVFEARRRAMHTVGGAGSLRGLLAHTGQAQVALARRTARRLLTSRGLFP